MRYFSDSFLRRRHDCPTRHREAEAQGARREPLFSALLYFFLEIPLSISWGVVLQFARSARLTFYGGWRRCLSVTPGHALTRD
jgi:hypothetical protein